MVITLLCFCGKSEAFDGVEEAREAGWWVAEELRDSWDDPGLCPVHNTSEFRIEEREG